MKKPTIEELKELEDFRKWKKTFEGSSYDRVQSLNSELLEACKSLLKVYHDNSFSWPLPLTNAGVFDKAKQVISKAEGGAKV